MENANYDMVWEELYNKSVIRLMAADVFDRRAFEDFKIYIEKRTSVLKNDYVLSKQIVSNLLNTINQLTEYSQRINEIENFKNIIYEFSLLLGYLANSIDSNERKPGIPRII